MLKIITKPLFSVFLLTLIGTFLHFYNVDWGAPYYFHPDERNIASAVSQLHFPNQMNPHFFAYGSLPIYAIYFTTVLTDYISQWIQTGTQSLSFTVPFEQAILIGRVYSALFATMLIPILFFLGKKIKNERTGLVSAFFATTGVGFIQFAHFGTFEMWLTFFSVLLFWLCLNYFSKANNTLLIFMALVFGILVSIKVTSLVLFIVPLTLIGTHSIQKTMKTRKSGKSETQIFRKSDMLSFLSILKNVLLFIIVAALIYILSNPYVFLDPKDFFSSMNYESSVALGTLPVFYTQIFLTTIPGLYQFLHVYPFLLNPLLVILFVPTFVYFIFQTIKTKNVHYLLIITFYLVLFLSQVVLFVKWTRYMVPTIPFIYLTVAIALSNVIARTPIKSGDEAIFKHWGLPRSLHSLAMTVIIIVCTIFAFSYFKTAFINPDTRIDALTFAQHAIPVDATILSEPSDLGVVPFQDAFPHIDTFNFYDLDGNSPDATETHLQQKLDIAQYIVLPSQRIVQSRIENPTRFPKGYLFYKSLLDGQLGFHKVYETPCDIFCKITYLGDPIYWWEQTASVFDRPTVFIFKKES